MRGLPAAYNDNNAVVGITPAHAGLTLQENI